jgi:hypothetical protein
MAPSRCANGRPAAVLAETDARGTPGLTSHRAGARRRARRVGGGGGRGNGGEGVRRAARGGGQSGAVSGRGALDGAADATEGLDGVAAGERVEAAKLRCEGARETTRAVVDRVVEELREREA